MTTGLHLQALRKRRGLTLDELSALSGVGRDDLGRYERGAATPRPETVRKIARALDAPIAAIREGMGWTAPEAAESWETAEGDELLREGILENLRESCGPGLALEEGDIRVLMESVKASIPALVEHMRDARPEAVVSREILEELKLAPVEDEEARIRAWELTDEQWEEIRPLLPPEKSGKGRAFKDNRLMLNGILYRMKSGSDWKDLPERYGRYKCVSDRLRLWRSSGVWEPVLRRLTELGVLDPGEKKTE